LMTTVYGFLFLRLIHGFSTGTKPTATAAYVVDIIPADRRGEAAGTLGLFTATGMSIGPTIGSLIADNFGMNPMFYTSSALALLSILILVQMKETLPIKQRFSPKLFILSRKELFEKAVFAPFFVNLLLSFSSGAAITLAPDLSKSLGIGNKGLFFTVYTISSLIIRFSTNKFSDKYGRVPILFISASILAVAMTILGFANTPFLFFLASVLFGMAWGMNSPTITAWTADLSNEENRGRSMATMYIALEAGIGIGAYFSGWIYQGDISKMAWAFYLSAFLAVAAVFYMWYYSSKRREVTEVL
jgi:MFS family permease